MSNQPQRLTIYIFLLLLLNISIANVLSASTNSPIEESNTQKSMFDVLSHSEIVKLTLKTDLSLLMANQKKDDYQKAFLEYEDADGQKIEMKLKIKPRGKYRRRVCDFAPLKLNFPEKDLAKAGLANFDKIKLVTHCLNDKTISKETVMREYLAYKLYHELAGTGLRVQLVKISYVDINSNKKIKNRYGFLIEDIDELAGRNNAEVCDCMNIEDSKLVAESESTNAFFQYMIGNADWDLKMLRNIKLLTNKSTGKVSVVPYDFDFSGLVDASYAIPNPDLKLASVQERAFLGLKPNKSQLKTTIAKFQNKQTDLINVISSFEYLDKEIKKEMIEYLSEFFTAIEKKVIDEDVLRWSSNIEILEEGSFIPDSSTNSFQR